MCPYTGVYLISARRGAHINSKLYKFTSFARFLDVPSGNCRRNEAGDSSYHLVAATNHVRQERTNGVHCEIYMRLSEIERWTMTMKRLNDNDDMVSPHIERYYCGLSQCYPQRVQGCTDNARLTRRGGSWYPFKAQELHLLPCLADREDHRQWYLKISINNLLMNRHSVSRTLISPLDYHQFWRNLLTECSCFQCAPYAIYTILSTTLQALAAFRHSRRRSIIRNHYFWNTKSDFLSIKPNGLSNTEKRSAKYGIAYATKHIDMLPRIIHRASSCLSTMENYGI